MLTTSRRRRIITVQEKKLALVTGASRGLGLATATLLASKNFHVIALARTVGALEELDDNVSASGGSVSLAPIDISDDLAMRQTFSTICSRWSTIDLVVHAAIYAPPLEPASTISQTEFNRAAKVNYTATLNLILCLQPLLSKSSTVVFFDDPQSGKKFFGAYGSSKSAQISLARSWQLEAVRVGPEIIIFQPSPMYTSSKLRFMPGASKESLSTPLIEAKRLLALLTI